MGISLPEQASPSCHKLTGIFFRALSANSSLLGQIRDAYRNSPPSLPRESFTEEMLFPQAPLFSDKSATYRDAADLLPDCLHKTTFQRSAVSAGISLPRQTGSARHKLTGIFRQAFPASLSQRKCLPRKRYSGKSATIPGRGQPPAAARPECLLWRYPPRRQRFFRLAPRRFPGPIRPGGPSGTAGARPLPRYFPGGGHDGRS